jgi:hypothetical protein
MKACWFCGTEAQLSRPSRDQVCSKCKMALKCCKNCRFFDPAAHNQCQDRAAEWVRDKELANFCEHFDFVEKAESRRAGTPEDARKKFDSLFGEK